MWQSVHKHPGMIREYLESMINSTVEMNELFEITEHFIDKSVITINKLYDCQYEKGKEQHFGF